MVLQAFVRPIFVGSPFPEFFTFFEILKVMSDIAHTIFLNPAF